MSKATYDKVDRLTDYAFSRLRTEVNFGSREVTELNSVDYHQGELVSNTHSIVPALSTYFREILDNALDECKKCANQELKGYGTTIHVTYDPETMVFSVEDNGRGIPSHLVEMVFTEARTGRNFRERDDVAGTNGVGAATTNFTSTYFKVDSYHDKIHHSQTFRENPKSDSKQLIEKAEVKKCPKAKHGTRIEFQPSPEVYPDVSSSHLSEVFLSARLNEIAAINPSIKFFYNGEPIKLDWRLEKSILAGRNPIIISIDETTTVTSVKHRTLGGETSSREGKFLSTFYLVPQFDSTGDDVSHTIVNNIFAYNGGVHMNAFKNNLVKGVSAAIEGQAKKRKLKPNKSDIMAGMLIYNVTSMAAPNFDSQAKNKLINEECRRIIDRKIDDDLWKKITKSNPEWVNSIFERCARRTGKKDIQDSEKDAKDNLKVKVAKLRDATNRKRSETILIIGEGDSAVNGAMNARDPRVYGGLPLRGKILNVNGEAKSRVIASEPMSDIMNALGLTFSDRANRSSLRYGKLFIATDEDEDGKNILSLIVNFLFTFWPELFDKDLPPFVYKLETPFIILKKKKERKYFYGANYREYKPEDWKGWEAARAKGLARLEQTDWRTILSNPPAIPIQDMTGTMKEDLDMIFNEKRADERKVWLGFDDEDA